MVRIISIDQWWKVQKIIANWQKQSKNNKNRVPNWAIVDGIKIYKKQLIDMKKRITDYKNKTGKYPGVIGIEGPAPKQANAESPKDAMTFTQWYNSMVATGYAHYKGDVYNPEEEDYNIEKHIAMNCSDYTQAGVRKAQKLGGYKTRYIHRICQSNEGHVTMEIIGREFKDWTEADIAAGASIGSKYPLGQVWCPNPKKRWISTEPWLVKNNGIMD